MSSYINFFIKRNDVYAPIGSFGRGSIIYRSFNGDYEKLKALTPDVIEAIKVDLKDDRIRCDKEINECAQKVDFIRGLNNSVDEKMQAFYDIDEQAKEIQQEMEDIEYALHFCEFLNDILNDCWEDSNNLDRNNYIFYGIEVPDPMVKMNNI